MDPFLQLHDATVVRSGKAILHIDDFQLALGENLALLGPNGSGKSTFIKLITREVLPLFREDPPVRFMGNPRATLAQVKSSVGIVSSTMQSQISVHLPAEDIVIGGLYGTLGLPHGYEATPRDRERAQEALGLVGIADLSSRDVMTLSTGQARRVLLAKSLIHEPQVLVLDEPCTGLDPEGMHYVRKSMRTLAKRGTTIVLVSHYPEDIIPEISRLVLLKEGALFADGPKEQLLTSQKMTELFDVPLKVNHHEAYFSLVSEY